VQGGVVTRGVRIVLAAGGSVSGRVYDERHAPLAAVDVGFDSASSVVESRAATKTDELGRYRLDGAPAGLLTLRAQRGGFRARLVSGLRVGSGATLTQDVTLIAADDGGAGLDLTGIGANLKLTDDGIELAAVGNGDPAERAGLREGDRILRIDGETSDAMSVADAVQRLRGEAGTSVGVSVERPKTGETLDVMIVRGVIVR
jgi:membrane-associated protease RseP (regulator of RpoE activity)